MDTRSDVLTVLAPNALGVAAARWQVRVAADRVPFKETDGVRSAVGDRGRNAGVAAYLPVFIPAAAEHVPIGGVARQRTGSPVIPGPAVRFQRRVARHQPEQHERQADHRPQHEQQMAEPFREMPRHNWKKSVVRRRRLLHPRGIMQLAPHQHEPAILQNLLCRREISFRQNLRSGRALHQFHRRQTQSRLVLAPLSWLER